MNIYQTKEYQDFAASVRIDDVTGAAALSDWLQECGVSAVIAVGTVLIRIVRVYDVWIFGMGSDSDSGSDIGWGSSIGRGSGRGRSIGSGWGSGRGRGSSIGSGIGRGSSESFRNKQMRVGQRYLIHCGDWHSFAGLVVDQLGPMTYELEFVSKIRETNNGDNWHDLASGNMEARRAAEYTHYKGRIVIPLTIAAFEWEGQLPQEAGL